MSVGVGWGQTLRHSLAYVPHKTYKNLSLVSLIGGFDPLIGGEPARNGLASGRHRGRTMLLLRRSGLYRHEATREMLMNQPMLRDVFERGRKVDLAFLSSGEFNKNCTMSKLGLITAEEVNTLLNAGAVGDLCSHWLDAKGQFVDHPSTSGLLRCRPNTCVACHGLFLVSGGKNKVLMMHGVLSAKLANIVVTDEVTARAPA